MIGTPVPILFSDRDISGPGAGLQQALNFSTGSGSAVVK